ncbi:MAG TPA: hypothetical protein VK842_02030 [bacterium]|nr:hypothetical protein [bacterium]
MNTKKSLVMVAGLAALFGGGSLGHAADAPASGNLLSSNGNIVNVDGFFKEVGELSYVEADDKRDKTRIYLFNTMDRIDVDGVVDGTKFSIETAWGGEADYTSNNQINLLEYMAETPLPWDGVTVFAGQFKNPANRDSAEDAGHSFFTQKDMLQQLFFNAGYDEGVGLHVKEGKFDALVGTLAGAPDLPQRYLPELLNLPMMFARIGIDSIGDDPFHAKGWGLARPDSTEYALHLNGMFMDDSNAGHSTNESLDSGYFTAPSANSYYGNVLLSSLWNPYLGKTNNGAAAEVYSTYGQASIDGQVRIPVGSASTLNLGAQVTWSEYTVGNLQGKVVINGVSQTSAVIDLLGGEAYAALETGTFDLAARVTGVLPSAQLMGLNAAPISASKAYTPITGTRPIWDITFPSIGWHVSKSVKITAETTFELNAPVDRADDGSYLIAEMPSQVTNSNPAKVAGKQPNYGFESTPIVPIGRMEFQFLF